MNCSQKGCTRTATKRYDWPGAGERVACDEHAAVAAAVAETLGVPLAVRELAITVEELRQAVTGFLGGLEALKVITDADPSKLTDEQKSTATATATAFSEAGKRLYALLAREPPVGMFP